MQALHPDVYSTDMNTKGYSFGTPLATLRHYNLINRFALQVGYLGEEVLYAHELGYGPGRYNDPWDPRFHELAAKLYATSFTPIYRRGLADSCLQVAAIMKSTPRTDEINFAWSVLRLCLESAANSIYIDPDIKKIDDRVSNIKIISTLPLHLYPEIFAALLSKQGANRLYQAAISVSQFCETYLPSMPSRLELDWIVAVAQNQPIQLLAERHQLSSRSAYRHLQSLWRQLRVKNAVQGVALAVQQRWITPPPEARVCPNSKARINLIPVPRNWQTCLPIPGEEQLICLQGLALGESHNKIAHELCYSNRQLERILSKMLNHLEVATPTQALALAVDNGWVTVQHEYV